MAKTSGLGSTLTVDDSTGSSNTDLSNDITNYSFSTPRGVQDSTGTDKSAHERLLLLADFSVTLNGVANFASGKQHDVFKTVSSTSVLRTTVINPIGTTSGFPKLPNEVMYTDYQLTRNNTGELTWQAPGSLGDGTVPTWTTN